MARFGLDYAWTQIAPQAHKAVGSSFACRYLSPDHSKNLTPAEAHALRQAGIDVVVVWESSANRALGGYAAGAADARAALVQASWCGQPANRPIYFAVDFDESPAQAAAVAEYFKGVNSVLGVERTGAYGGYWVIKRLFDAGLIRYGWQTYAWSGGNLDRRAHIYQYSNGHRVAGQDCDFNRALVTDFGQFDYHAPPPPPRDPVGRWHFSGYVDMNDRSWHIQAEPGENVAMGGHDRVWEAKVGVAERDGQWRIDSLPFA